MTNEKTPEDVRKEIEESRGFLNHLNEFGMGHLNVHESIRIGFERKTRYCGEFLPEGLYAETKFADEELEELCQSLDNASSEVPIFTLIQQTPIKEYMLNLLYNARQGGLISEEQYKTYERRKGNLLKEGPFRQMFLRHGQRERRLHQDYISFLESCLKQS